jgi:hypothetical protein
LARLPERQMRLRLFLDGCAFAEPKVSVVLSKNAHRTRLARATQRHGRDGFYAAQQSGR